MAKNISFTETDVLLPPDAEGEEIPEVPGLHTGCTESLPEFTNKIRIEVSGTVFIIQERGTQITFIDNHEGCTMQLEWHTSAHFVAHTSKMNWKIPFSYRL